MTESDIGDAIPSKELKLLRKATTGMVVDALRMANMEGAIPGILPVRGFEGRKIIGRAATVAYGPVRAHDPGLSMYQAIRTCEPGSVLVVDGKGLPNHFVGDNMGETAKRRGLQAIVVYGGARDVDGYRRLDLPLFCTGPAVEPYPSTFKVNAQHGSIVLGRIVIVPGDILVADEDGVVAIPSESLATTCEHLLTVMDVESQLEDLLQRDAPTPEIMQALSKKSSHSPTNHLGPA